MADLVINDSSVTVVLSAAERIESVHGDVSVPRSSVVGARQVPDGLAEVHGIRARGTTFPGVVMVGSWRESGSVTFAACHGHRPAVVVDDLESLPHAPTASSDSAQPARTMP